MVAFLLGRSRRRLHGRAGDDGPGLVGAVSVAPSDGVDLYYERAGAGPPVLLVMGLGMNATGWWRTVPVLAEEFTVLSFDNRGVGRSGRPPGPY